MKRTRPSLHLINQNQIFCNIMSNSIHHIQSAVSLITFFVLFGFSYPFLYPSLKMPPHPFLEDVEKKKKCLPENK